MSEEKIGVAQLGTEQFVALDFILLDSEIIGADEKILYAMLKRFKNRNSKFCYPSLHTLCVKLGWTKKTLLKKLDNLIDVGLIRKIASRSPKSNNQYILYPPQAVLGGKQLNISDLTEDERDVLAEIDAGQIIHNEKTGKIMICASEKLAFYMRQIYKRIEIYWNSIKNNESLEETEVIIEDIKRFYEGIASCPYVLLDKRITDSSEKIKSEDYLEKVKDFDFESIVEVVRSVKINGVPSEFKTMSESSYVLSYLWAKRDVFLKTTLINKIEETSKQIKI
mgnify:CR=1 FL=1